ncbi:MAG: putative lipid II flippase FtsW [Acidobacteriota bacterium]|nr:putative lipid II flippase FtsW [Acidobacteriota bacterium]
MAKKLAFDRILFTVVIVLVGFGLTMVYSASVMVGGRGEGGNALILKQALAAVIGLAAMWLAMHTDYRWLRRKVIVWSMVGGVAVLLLLALLSPELNNTRRWLFVGGFSFQPSELAKFVVVVFLAYQMTKYEESDRASRYLVPAVMTVGFLVILVLLGRDLGSALMLAAIAGLLLVLAGIPFLPLLTGALLTAPVVIAAVVMVPYRRQRFLAFLDPEKDPLGAGFQALQSLIALGSGGWIGVGLGQSVQKLRFLPYPHSDFVFAIVGEELGFIGALAVVALFLTLLWRGVRAGLRAPDPFGKYLAWGLSGAITVQALVHISVATSVLPATGITLPFISYGGSSLVVTLVTCGLLLNVSQHG